MPLDGVQVGVERDGRGAGVAAARRGFGGACIAGIGQAEAHIQIAGAAVCNFQQTFAHGDGRDFVDDGGGQLQRVGQHRQRHGPVQVRGLQQQTE
ncbi:hypothetical protein D9M72_584650 [compost metagenome]